jgi:hypothetical protein
MADGSAAVSWIEFADKRATFMVRRIDRTGTRGAPLSVVALGANRNNNYPRMARGGDELVFAWPDAETLRVQTAVVRMH